MGVIKTASGRRVEIGKIRREDVCIEDVAHALSRLCRFNGHTRDFYSVAQHSIFVAKLVRAVDPRLSLAGLLHDSGEAYVGDETTPLKELIPDLRVYDKQAREAVFHSLDLPPELPPVVKQADHIALLYEQKYQMKSDNDDDIRLYISTTDIPISSIALLASSPEFGLDPSVAYKFFIRLFETYQAERFARES